MSIAALLSAIRILMRASLVSLLVILADRSWPLYACGCGVYIPRENDGGNVLQERALLRWDGQSQEIVMELDVAGESSEAAWILPVPARAEVKLGDAALFHALYELTRPQIEARRRQAIPGFGGAASEGAVGAGRPVTVLERSELCPFEVSNLAASDAAALADWLDENGYTFPPGLDEVVRPYVEENWYFVAIRLRRAEADQAL
ncbi:MAG TPA: DUF2330 domain-containing protein, partial [Caldilineaceae bacterium]|nr:DUF2330 domain-containing protein [Caldilineaceae bacterium]